MAIALDHLVVAAATLEQGAAWCEATLGVAPETGGRHALMGTHNRLLALAGGGFADSYLEIIALDPDAPPPRRARWFGLDDAALQDSLREHGPRLLHWVARTARLDDEVAALRAAGGEPGTVLAAERATPDGVLRWRITVRDDGLPLHGGALPTLIEWQGRHPASSLPARGVALHRFEVGGLPPPLAAWLDAATVACPSLVQRPFPGLAAWLDTPRGPVRLASA